MMKSDYEMELDYQVELMRATVLRSRADELAEELFKFGELTSAGKLTGNDRDLRIAALHKLVEEIKNDQAQLEKFRWAYLYRVARKQIEGGRRQDTDAVTKLCKENFKVLLKYLGCTYTQLKNYVEQLRTKSTRL
ncbi:MAG TPA: hypothetical protein VKM94_01615 [Blastocatellia bacterium]|nr:hypothetical protein [Blastocatellia bacterium]